MNTSTVILVALALALLLLAAFYGLSSAVIGSGDEAIDNFTEPLDEEGDNFVSGQESFDFNYEKRFQVRKS